MFAHISVEAQRFLHFLKFFIFVFSSKLNKIPMQILIVLIIILKQQILIILLILIDLDWTMEEILRDMYTYKHYSHYKI